MHINNPYNHENLLISSMTNKRDENRDRIFLGDLQNLSRLKDVESPSQDDVRLYASIVRRLLLDGILPAVAGSRKMPLKFLAPDDKPILTKARQNQDSFFIMGGVNIFGLKKLEGLLVIGQSATVKTDTDDENRIQLNYDKFLSQTAAYLNGRAITRRDIIAYISNKAGGVHFDMKPTKSLPEEKLSLIAQLRTRLGLSVSGGKIAVNISQDIRDGRLIEEQLREFRYDPEYIDAAFLEFLAVVHIILESPDVQALRTAVLSDYKSG